MRRKRGGSGEVTGGTIMLIFLVGIPLYLLVEHTAFVIVILIAIAAVIILKERKKERLTQVDISSVDIMSGEEFEEYVAQLLRKNGFMDVQITKASGDYGVDILAIKYGERYAIQCKRYAKNVGVKPIQEVYAGASMYGATRCAVITNVYFSDNGRTLADKLGVELWDRSDLMRMIANASV